MGTKAWIIFAVLVVGILGALVYTSQSNRLDVSDVDTNQVLAASDRSGGIGDHVRGNTESGNLLVEYGDFQCPGCAAAYPHVETVVEKYKDKMAYVYRNFPLSSMHPNALAASTAAEAAGVQDKFWDMYNYLFTNQQDWVNSKPADRKNLFTKYASQLGIDTEKFAADYDKEDLQKKIDFDLALGAKDKVTGTPSFLFNGEAMPAEVADSLINGDIEAVSKWIDSKLN